MLLASRPLTSCAGWKGGKQASLRPACCRKHFIRVCTWGGLAAGPAMSAIPEPLMAMFDAIQGLLCMLAFSRARACDSPTS